MVARWQLEALGLKPSAIESRIRRGELLRLHRGVYAVGYAPLTERGRWMAAVLAAGPDAALSHRTAALLWGVAPRWEQPPEVSRPRKFGRVEGFLGHHAALPADEVAIEDGIPVTSVPRTVFDCAAILPFRQLERLYHEVEVRQLRDPLSLPHLIARHPGQRGVANLRRLLASRRAPGITRNDFEEAFATQLAANGLPCPRFNPSLHLRGEFFQPDALWPAQRLIAELDGGAVHRTHRNFHSDRRRDRILLAEGYRTTRITWDQLQHEPAEVIADLRLLLGRG